MHKETLIEMLFSQPFEPFAIHVSDGRCFAVRHPEFAIVANDHVVVAQPSETEHVAEKTHFLSLRHVTSVSPIGAAAE